jgi:hypothetical protein
MSEFDQGFADVIARLSARFPGIEVWRELEIGPVFEERERVLGRAETSRRFAHSLIRRPGVGRGPAFAFAF